MSFFKSGAPLESVKDILMLNKDAGLALLKLHNAVLRQDSELTVHERESIAAYVSGLNDCDYCHGVHTETAKAFGVSQSLLTALVQDVDTAPIEDRLKSLFVYARQLTLEPSKATQAQVDAILQAGWSEQAVHDLIQVVALFNLMNRLVEGHGISGNQNLYEERGGLLKVHGYNQLSKIIEDSTTS